MSHVEDSDAAWRMWEPKLKAARSDTLITVGLRNGGGFHTGVIADSIPAMRSNETVMLRERGATGSATGGVIYIDPREIAVMIMRTP
jgi:hypothetical protein